MGSSLVSRRSVSKRSGGTISVLTTQHRSMPLAAMNPNCRNALKSVTKRDT